MTSTARRNGVRFFYKRPEVHDMNSNAGVFSDGLAQSLSERFNATAASYDRTAMRIALTLRSAMVSSNGKPATGR
jgi:hypothetical protein